MLRIVGFAVAALACASAAAQNYSGTFTTTNPAGGKVTLTLEQDAQQQVKGTLSGNDNTFQVAAEATPQGLMGTVTGEAGNLYIMAQYEGANLVVILAEPGPGGQANLQSARRIVFARAAAGGTPGSAAAKKAPAAPPAAAAGGKDAELSAFLTRNAWCSFRFSKSSGTTSTERVLFNADGTIVQTGNTETYSSGHAGTVAGQHGSGQRAFWKVTDGMLQLSADGTNWTPQQLKVTYNSNGAPIIVSGGKEYMICR